MVWRGGMRDECNQISIDNCISEIDVHFVRLDYTSVCLMTSPRD